MAELLARGVWLFLFLKSSRFTKTLSLFSLLLFYFLCNANRIEERLDDLLGVHLGGRDGGEQEELNRDCGKRTRGSGPRAIPRG